MDTSREYLRMCREAKEIQKSWRPTNGDWWHIGARDLSSTIMMVESGGKIKWSDSYNIYDLNCDIDMFGIVWLPRQDQIQKFIYDHQIGQNQKTPDIAGDFMRFLSGMEHREKLSLEKLWLIYFMSSIYQKSWKEGRWVKEINNQPEQKKSTGEELNGVLQEN